MRIGPLRLFQQDDLHAADGLGELKIGGHVGDLFPVVDAEALRRIAADALAAAQRIEASA